MRRWLLLLMVVLLPLRGWAGDLMSIRMATGDRAASASAAMPSDCAMHRAIDAAAQGTQPEAAPAVQSCSSCDLCVPLAVASAGVFDVAGFASHERPPAPGAGFVSACLALPAVPPIV